MEDGDCDPLLLRNTYAQFSTVNRVVAGWGRLIERFLAPRLEAGSTVLDVGCGGGDLVRRLASWGESRGTPLAVTGIDPDARALSFARSRAVPRGVEYRRASLEELAANGERFHFVLSNHLLHHLSSDRVAPFLEASAAVVERTALHNDLRRHWLALAAFSLTGPLFPRSFIREDGVRSIRRSFIPSELRPLLPPGWRVEPMVPFRNLVILER